MVDVTPTQEDRWKTCPKGSCQRHQSCMYANCTFGSITRPAPDGEAVATYRHAKRGTTYAVIGKAELQMNADVVDGSEMVVYRGEDGRLWVREYGEFHDGRFEYVEETHPPRNDAVVEAMKSVRLWALLDDIDTLDDACRGDDTSFREQVRVLQRKRFDIMSGEDWDYLAALSALKQGEA